MPAVKLNNSDIDVEKGKAQFNFELLTDDKYISSFITVTIDDNERIQLIEHMVWTGWKTLFNIIDRCIKITNICISDRNERALPMLHNSVLSVNIHNPNEYVGSNCVFYIKFMLHDKDNPAIQICVPITKDQIKGENNMLDEAFNETIRLLQLWGEYVKQKLDAGEKHFNNYYICE